MLRGCLEALPKIFYILCLIFMQLIKYRYRPVHAISERFFEILAPLLPAVEGKTVLSHPEKFWYSNLEEWVKRFSHLLC